MPRAPIAICIPLIESGAESARPASSPSASRRIAGGGEGAGSTPLHAPPREHHLHRLGEDAQVEPQRAIVDVCEVVLELGRGGGVILAVHLGVAGEPWPHLEALGVALD